MIALKEAIKLYGKPEIINSDQGSQFTLFLWTDFLEKHEIKISMAGKGRAINNIYIERFLRTLKQDFVYISPAEDGLELYSGIKDFISHCNYRKTHQEIGRLTPISIYKQIA